jgi:UDP-N-acetylmuramate dehydrogenase
LPVTVYTAGVKIQENAELAPLTSFEVGGPAEKLITLESSDELAETLNKAANSKIWPLGYGTNVLISDEGLPGTTILFRNKAIEWQGNTVVADAGVWWDDLVKESINRGLWGLELTSGVPGSVGAAVFINITAYGQAQSDKLLWADYMDSSGQINRLSADAAQWDYKKSVFQEHEDWLIMRAAYGLNSAKSSSLTYQSALDVAGELNLNPDSLSNRREIILEARQRAGSIFIPGQNYARTVGSFFRNPVVTEEQADLVIEFDETKKSTGQIKAMNQVHGGNQMRVSAAHVLLAAGFSRGQIWGDVRLHPNNLLKIENMGNASAQNIYDVAQEIIQTVKSRLDIDLKPEARILGQF